MATSKPSQLFARIAPIFIIILGLISIIDLGLGINDAVRLSQEPVDQFYTRHFGPGPTTAQIVFYSATLPFVSTLWCIIDSCVFLRIQTFRRVIISLVGAVLLLVGWTIQVAFWTNCEQLSRDDNGLQKYCPQWAMRKAIANQAWLDTESGTAKYAFGWIATFGYFGYMTFTAVMVDRAKKEEKAALATTKLDSHSITKVSFEMK